MPDLRGPVGSDSSRLVVIRGSSGSGKSSVAAAVRAARPTGSVVIVGQDLLRREVLGTNNDDGGHPIGLTDLISRYALSRGFDVVVEGILNADRYGEMLRRLVADHRGVSRCYLYDLTFEETVRRHATRPLADAFSAAEMQTWWRGCQPVDQLGEVVVEESDSLAETVARVLRDCWSLP